MLVVLVLFPIRMKKGLLVKKQKVQKFFNVLYNLIINRFICLE
jgi:hypothetical protein